MQITGDHNYCRQWIATPEQLHGQKYKNMNLAKNNKFLMQKYATKICATPVF